MTNKEPSLKTKIGYTDYSVWEKYDVDVECEKLDSNNDEDADLTDEWDETASKEAYDEKDKGNKFVKEEKWNEAIECYNKAILLYSLEPIFYANRALCYLKKELYEKAVTDCNISLSLDNSYIKAYQRRAAAFQGLEKWNEAKSDYEKALELEPKNEQILENLKMIENKVFSSKTTDRRPISQFSSQRKKLNKISLPNFVKKEYFLTDNKQDEVIPVKAVNKPIQFQSKQPLKRVEIQEKEQTSSIKDLGQDQKPSPIGTIRNTNDLKIIERQPPQTTV